ncbi:Baculoviral IAP repeat-containing protein 5 [Coemansia helicoidea]|uniref:Baculoviral IAP repeat-containing protein 5 n=1 Tax=Coemansia helicoidea TaxID=1286919 RepID=A0ACC1LEJ3_9FUNG|nr:Baculoviral IAP repeat-containing protein 5 [Coemansia helicoidea]
MGTAQHSTAQHSTVAQEHGRHSMKQGCRTCQERRDKFLRRGRFRWPYLKYSSYLAQPDTLASAGFVFGPANAAPGNVQCFRCGFELTGWEATDDPFAEHYSHQPGCAYARLHCQTRTAVVFW